MNGCLKLLAIGLLSVISSAAFAQGKDFVIDVQRIDTAVYVYHFTTKIDTQTVAANGLIVEGKDSVILVETPWDLTQTIGLINWITEHLRKPIGLIVITHTHPNRLGGLTVLLSDKFPVYGSVMTVEEAVKNGYRPPDYQFLHDTTFHCSGVSVETFYPGPGHIQENIVVYFSEQSILFGGNFLMNAKATSLGNIGDADASIWLQGVKRLTDKYPHPKIVVPGSGSWEYGAIETTEKLLQAVVHKSVKN